MKQSKARRSPCPIACTLDLIGDRWTLLVIRDLYLGRTRFKELVLAPEAPPTNILSDRLNRLCLSGLVRQIPSKDGTKHRAYELTEKGLALLPVLRELRDWGLRWISDTDTKVVMSGRYSESLTPIPNEVESKEVCTTNSERGEGCLK